MFRRYPITTRKMLILSLALMAPALFPIWVGCSGRAHRFLARCAFTRPQSEQVGGCLASFRCTLRCSLQLDLVLLGVTPPQDELWGLFRFPPCQGDLEEYVALTHAHRELCHLPVPSPSLH